MDSEATFFQMTGITKSYWMGMSGRRCCGGST